MRLSVVIPTYNRKEILLECLRALDSQTLLKDRYEVLVVDNGSTDGTQQMLQAGLNRYQMNISFLNQPKRGPAAARNLGIQNARGDVLLLLGDDIIATKDLLAKHLEWHIRNPQENLALLGLITWIKEKKITLFMEWLEEGVQFDYPNIRDEDYTDYKHFYSSNVSLKKSFMTKYGIFDEDFPYASYEDSDLAYRLQLCGLKIYYLADLIAYHDHYTSIAASFRRMVKVGRSSKIFMSKHPELLRGKKIDKNSDIIKNLKSSLRCFLLRLLGKLIFMPVIKLGHYIGKIQK